MTTQRKYYLFAAVVFTIGAVLAIVGGAYGALVIFTVLAMMMFWVQSRVDRFIEARHPGHAPQARQQGGTPRSRELRPSERRQGRRS